MGYKIQGLLSTQMWIISIKSWVRSRRQKPLWYLSILANKILYHPPWTPILWKSPLKSLYFESYAIFILLIIFHLGRNIKQGISGWTILLVSLSCFIPYFFFNIFQSIKLEKSSIILDKMLYCYEGRPFC